MIIIMPSLKEIGSEASRRTPISSIVPSKISEIEFSPLNMNRVTKD